MLTIRLFRVGRKNQAAFKIVVTDKRNAASRGRFVEEVGFYNPLTKQRNLKGDRVKYWMSVGAKPSDTVYNMLITDGVIEGKKIPKHKESKKDPSTSSGQEQGTETPAVTEQTPEAPQEALKEQPKEEPNKEEVPAEDSSAEAPAKEEPSPPAGGEEEKPADVPAESVKVAENEEAESDSGKEEESKQA